MRLGTNHHEHQLGATRFRITPWQDDPTIAHLVAIGPNPPNATDIIELCAHLPTLGYTGGVTAALAPHAQPPFIDNGFTHVASLALLVLDLTRTPDSSKQSKLHVRRGGRRHLASVLELDAKCFPPDWRFTKSLLYDAMDATAASRYRVVTKDGQVLGYAITGYAAGHGYLQRLAVDPSVQRQGIARYLVDDSSKWIRHNNGRDLTVNTMASNTAALDFYLRLGFVRDEDGLDVLRIDLNASAHQMLSHVTENQA